MCSDPGGADNGLKILSRRWRSIPLFHAVLYHWHIIIRVIPRLVWASPRVFSGSPGRRPLGDGQGPPEAERVVEFDSSQTVPDEARILLPQRRVCPEDKVD